MSGNQSISLEIYGLKGGRWSIHANYSVQQREKCLEDAKELDGKGRFEAVCVVRETYSEESNVARQAVIYHSPKLSSPPPVATVTENAGKGGAPTKPVISASRNAGEGGGAWRKSEGADKKPKQDAPQTEEEKKPKPAAVSSPDGPTLADVLPRLLAVAVVSLLGALVVAYLVYILIQMLPSFDIILGKTVSQSIIISVFVISFLFMFIPLMKRYVPAIQSSAARRNTQNAAMEPAVDRMPILDSDLDDDIDTDDDYDTELGSEDANDDNQIGEIESGLGAGDAGAEEAGEEPDPDEPTEADGEEELAQTGSKSSLKKPKKTDVSAEMLKFIRDSLEPLAKAGRPLNAFNRFGLTLFFAGAGEYMASRHRLSEQEITDILCSHVQILGHTADMARGFCANIDEYLVNPKYFQMYEKGRSALAAHAQNPDGELAITDAIDDWNKPAEVKTKSDKEFVAVLFTDIVGSTALTQERGDDEAQLVVREHNAIVRDALALHGGKEIKHTGDGIMATFSQITGAVEGAVAMQEACLRANGTNPELGLGLCIGVNAGEPIHEDGDIFGTPVQMAARVLSKAEGEEIAVSNLVREMCTGKSFNFSKKGEYELKGFPEPVPIYLVDWQDASDAPKPAKKSA